VYGTWKLVSEHRKILDTGEMIDTNRGVTPLGFITYGKDGRVMVLLVRGVRPKPASLDTMTDQQGAELFRSMLAYAGTYTFDGTTVQHHIDISWNELWTGTTLVRDVQKDGDRLVYTTRPAPFSGDGKVSSSIVVWEKVK
jgi:Lipocalin-like domain